MYANQPLYCDDHQNQQHHKPWGEVSAPINTPIYLKIAGNLTYDNNVNWVSNRWTPPFHAQMRIAVDGTNYMPSSYTTYTYSTPNVFTRTQGTYNVATSIVKTSSGNLRVETFASCIVSCNYQALSFGGPPMLVFQLSTLPPTSPQTPTITCTTNLGGMGCTQVDPYTVTITKTSNATNAWGEVSAPSHTPIYLKLTGIIVYDNNVNYFANRWTPPFHDQMAIIVNGTYYSPSSYSTSTYTNPTYTRTLGTYNLETFFTKTTSGNLRFDAIGTCIVACNYAALSFGGTPNLVFQLSTNPFIPTSTNTPTPTSTATPSLTPTFTPTATFTPSPTVTPTFTATATTAPSPYLGSGYFPTNSLSYCHVGSSYFEQSRNASGQWSADTNIDMYYDCASPKITVIYADFSSTGNFAGRAYICNINGQCGNSEAYNSAYNTCQVWLNSDAIEGNPFYTDAEVQKLILHELGHCYSLAHSSDPTSVMGNGSIPNADDIYWINQRY